MNCPECGHSAEEHVCLIGCIFQTEDKNGEPVVACECSASRAEIECDAWRAEALAARQVIAMQHEPTWGEYHDVFCAYCKTHWRAEPKHTDTCPYGVAMQKYLAARVNDEKETPC